MSCRPLLAGTGPPPEDGAGLAGLAGLAGATPMGTVGEASPSPDRHAGGGGAPAPKRRRLEKAYERAERAKVVLDRAQREQR